MLSVSVHGATFGHLYGRVLRRQRVAGEPRVDALGVRGERLLGFDGEDRQVAFGGAPQTQRPHLDVAGYRAGADQLGQRARGPAPIDVHLEHPVSGVHIALQEEQVVRVGRPYVGNAVDVPDHRRGPAQAGYRRPGRVVSMPRLRKRDQKAVGQEADGE
jgi:hypothetical protein